MEQLFWQLAEKSVIAGAFVYLLIYVVKLNTLFNNKTSKTLEKISETLKEISNTMSAINHRIETLEVRVNDLEGVRKK